MNHYEIGSIRIEGIVLLTKEEILSKVRSRVGELFDAATADEDVERIAELPDVERCWYNTDEIVDNKIILKFVIWEMNIVRSIVFVGNRKVKGKTLRGKLDFKVGAHLDVTLAEVGREDLEELYLKKGFAFAQVALDSEQLSTGKVIYTISEGPRVKIDSIKFSGNKTLKTGALKKTIKIKKERWFVLPAYYVEEHVKKDVTSLQNIYYERGFLDIRVTYKKEFNKDKSKIRLTFVIDEGPAYTVAKIVITGNKHFDEKQLRSQLKLEQGQIYNKRKADSDAERLLKLYREQGFVDVKVEQRREFLEAKHKVDVVFEITEGEQFRIGRVDITGNERTQDKVVRRVLDEYDFHPGQWYNAHIAPKEGGGELEKEIRRMVLAETATIRPVGEVPGQRDAWVSIKEAETTGASRFIAGVSSDMGIIGGGVLEQGNFNISDWPRNFIELFTFQPPSRGAGQTFKISLTPGTEVSVYSVSFREPYFRDRPTSLDVIGLSRKWERECYDESTMRGRFGFEKRYRNRWRRSIGFRLENVKVDSLDSDAPKEIVDVEGDNVLAGVRFGIRRDLTDNLLNPSTGYRFDAGYEQVGGDHTFGILSGTYSRYKTIYEDLAGRKTILATKLLAGTVIGDAPPFEKFYAGGMGTYGIRGFDYRGVSTRGGTGKDPIGSDWIFLANAEVAVPLVGKEIAALFFVDSGMVDSGGYRAAVGTGIQILIPHPWFGSVPMRFEIATPFMKSDEDDAQVFSFSIGRLF